MQTGLSPFWMYILGYSFSNCAQKDTWCTTHEKCPYAFCGQRRSGSACAYVQSNMGIFCLTTYTTVSTDSVSRQWRLRSACTYGQADQGLCCPQIRYIRALFMPCVSHVFAFKITCVIYASRNCLTPSPMIFLTLVLLNPDRPCFSKQGRSRSVGFWRSQLIWICTVCHSDLDLHCLSFIYVNNLDQITWLAEN